MEEKFIEMLNMAYHDGYAELLKQGDPIQYEIGLREFSEWIEFNNEII